MNSSEVTSAARQAGGQDSEAEAERLEAANKMREARQAERQAQRARDEVEEALEEIARSEQAQERTDRQAGDLEAPTLECHLDVLCLDTRLFGDVQQDDPGFVADPTRVDLKRERVRRDDARRRDVARSGIARAVERRLRVRQGEQLRRAERVSLNRRHERVAPVPVRAAEAHEVRCV